MCCILTEAFLNLTEVFLNLTEVSLTLTEVFPCLFLSYKTNARVKLAKTGHGPHLSTLVVICVVRLLFMLFYVLFVCKCVLPPGDNPIAVNKCIISYITTKSSGSCCLGKLPFILRGIGSTMRINVSFFRQGIAIMFNPLNAKLNAICYFLALLGAHPILHVSRIRVNCASK